MEEHNKTRAFSARIPEPLYRAGKALAEKEERSFNWVIKKALESFTKTRKGTKGGK